MASKARFSGVLGITSTILVAAGILGALYFFKIERNEDYQNQLHFRELNEVGQGFSNTLSQLKSVADVRQTPLIAAIELLEKKLAEQRQVGQQQAAEVAQLTQTRSALIGEISGQIDASQQQQVRQLSSQSDDLQQQENQLSRTLLEHRERRALLEEQIEFSLLDYLEAGLGAADDSYAQLAITHCQGNQQQAYCGYIENIFTALTVDLPWLNRYYQGQAPVSEEVLQKWKARYQGIREQLVAQQQLLAKLAKQRQNTAGWAEQVLAELCQYPSQPICSGWQNAPVRKSTRKSRKAKSSSGDLAERLLQQNTPMRALNRQQIQLLDNFAADWQKLVTLLNERQSAGSPLLDNVFADMQAAKQSYYEQEQTEQQLAEVRKTLEVAERQRKIVLGSNVDRYSHQQLDSQVRLQALEERLQKLHQQVQNRQYLWQQALDSAKASIMRLYSGSVFLRDNNVSRAEQMLLLLPFSVAEVSDRHQQVLDNFKQAILPTLLSADLRQRVQLANGSDGLRHLLLNRVTQSSAGEDDDAKIQSGENSQKFTLKIKQQALLARFPQGEFSLPATDLLPADSRLFPLLLLTDTQGRILARRASLQASVEPADLAFIQADGFFASLAGQQQTQNDKQSLPQYSGMLEREIGGVPYRVFVQPLALNVTVNNGEQMYLIGLVPASEMRLAKLSVSPGTGLWFVLGLVALLASVPLIKLLFVSVHYTFSQADISQLGLGLLILIGVICIGASDQLFFNYYKDTRQDQAHSLHKAIKHDFAQELKALLAQRDKLNNGQAKDQAKDQACISNINQVSDERSQVSGGSHVAITNCTNAGLLVAGKGSKTRFVIEGQFQLQQNGLFHAQDAQAGLIHLSPMRWLHSGLHIANDIALDYRQYFRQALNCNLWGSDQQSCRQGFTIERIANVRDARKSSQFAFAEYESIFESSPRVISSFGTHLRTFMGRVMPKDFGYLVFDESGQVLYHDQDERSLLENVFVETNNNLKLRSLSKYQQARDEPVEIDTLYRNTEHVFVVGALHRDMPWYLVVYQQQSPVMISNMLLVFISLSLFIVLITALFLSMRYTTEQAYWRHWLRYRPGKDADYERMAYCLLGASIMVWLSMGVLHELAARLLLWSALLFVGLWVLQRQLCVRWLVPWYRRPGTPALLLSLFFLILLALRLEHVSWGMAALNWGSLLFGLVLAAVCGWLAWRVKPRQGQRISRFSHAFVWYWVALIWFVAAVPAVLIVNSANKYLLQHQSQLQAQHWDSTEQAYQQKVDSYLQLMRLTPDDYQYQDWLAQPAMLQAFPAAKAGWVNLQNHQPQSADFIVQSWLDSADLGGVFDSELHYLRNRHLAVRDVMISYDADKFLLAAAGKNWLWLMIVQFVLVGALYWLVRSLLLKRLLGEHLADNFRQTTLPDKQQNQIKLAWLVKKYQTSMPVRWQLIRSNPARVLSCLSAAQQPVFRARVLPIFEACMQAEHLLDELQAITPTTLVLQGLDDLAFDKNKRQAALTFLQRVSALPQVHILLLCDIAPLYRLSQQGAYPNIDPENYADASEMLAWSSLLSQFDKHVDWSPANKDGLPPNATHQQLLAYERCGWLELEGVGQIFEQYHHDFKCQQGVQDDTLEKHWTQQQIIDFFCTQASTLYRRKWQQCTRDEKVLLYQMATGACVNPANLEVLLHLLRRGYLFRDQGWHLVNQSFRRFVLSAEKPGNMRLWLAKTRRSFWQYVRLPIMVIVLVLVAMILFASGEGVESVLGIMSAALGLVPLLLRNFASGQGGD